MGGRGASSSAGGINSFINGYKALKEKRYELYEKYDTSTEKGKQQLDKARFDLNKEFYKKYQDGKANKDNFYIQTMAEFEKTERPNREPDFVSKDRNGHISSRYWYTEDGVIRGSNHWGNNIASCDWWLKGSKPNMSGSQVKYGFAKWQEFTQKPSILKTNNKTIMSNFKNTIGQTFLYNKNLGIYLKVPKIKNFDINENTEEKIVW